MNVASPASLPELRKPSIISSDEETPESLVSRAQAGSDEALEGLFQRFRPLLRARMQHLWASVREDVSPVEWDDVESQVNYAFFYRTEKYKSDRGVFFAYYIDQMVTLDCKAWLREQKRRVDMPFSQLDAGCADPDFWLQSEYGISDDVDNFLSLRSALQDISPNQHDAIWQVCVLGRTEEETAEFLNISRSAVRNRLESGIYALRESFENSSPQHTTRTGRHSAKLALLDYCTERLHMAKDEKRPDLVGVGAGRPILLQGIFKFEATGLENSKLLSPRLRYVVPAGFVAGIRFLRVGIICEQMVCLSTVVNGMTHRLVPVAANQSAHVPFAIVEPIVAGSEIEIHIASNVSGTAIIDVGCLQMPA